ncbi:unnamed protein product, partial [Prorocentrum cordatum]
PRGRRRRGLPVQAGGLLGRQEQRQRAVPGRHTPAAGGEGEPGNQPVLHLPETRHEDRAAAARRHVLAPGGDDDLQVRSRLRGDQLRHVRQGRRGPPRREGRRAAVQVVPRCDQEVRAGRDPCGQHRPLRDNHRKRM